MKYLDPKTDLTFKKVFGEHPHLLKSFLNALLPLPEGSFIESLEYLPADLVPENPLSKYSIVDVRCKDNRGRQFIVEMQMHWTKGFMQRVLFNASKAYVRQLGKSFKFDTLQPVYALCLLNENFQPNKKEHYHHYQIVNIEDTDQQIEGLEFVFVELQKFKATNLAEKRLQVLWLRFLTEIDENISQAPTELLESTEIKEALEHLETSAFTQDQLDAYEKYWDSVRIEMTIQSESYSKGWSKGRAEGMAKGMAKGKAEGKAEGEQQKAIMTVLIGIEKNIPHDVLVQLTGLPDKEVEQLAKLYQQYGKDAIEHLDETN